MAIFNKDKIKELASQATAKGEALGKTVGKSVLSAGSSVAEKVGSTAVSATEGATKIKENLEQQRTEIAEKGYSESAFNVTQQAISKVASVPIVKVNREDFLRKTFGDSPYIDTILAEGPQVVFTTEALRNKADEVIRNSTRKTTAASFVSGLPSNPVGMVAAGAADITQFFAFALNLAQKIAYIFGEDQLFDDKADLVSKNGAALPEDAQIRIISYIGGMMGVSGASGLIAKTSQKAGQSIGKKVASQALTKTTWYPLVKKVGSMMGYKITKKSVESVITKTVPIIGGVISGGITYASFRPMGGRLADVFVKYLNGEFDMDMELNPDFEQSLREMDEDIIDMVEEDEE